LLRDESLALTLGKDAHIYVLDAFMNNGKFRQPVTLGALITSLGPEAWNSIELNFQPVLGDLLRFVDANGASPGGMTVREVAENGTTWIATDTTSRTTVVAVGTAVRHLPTNDGLHPYPASHRLSVSLIPQSEKAKLAG
jgi:hypothetical protein